MIQHGQRPQGARRIQVLRTSRRAVGEVVRMDLIGNVDLIGKLNREDLTSNADLLRELGGQRGSDQQGGSDMSLMPRMLCNVTCHA